MSQEERTKLREGVPYVKLYRYNPKHLYPKLNGYGDNGKRSLELCQLLHTYWLPNSYWNWQEYVVSVMLISVLNIKVTCRMYVKCLEKFQGWVRTHPKTRRKFRAQKKIFEIHLPFMRPKPFRFVSVGTLKNSGSCNSKWRHTSAAAAVAGHFWCLSHGS